MTGGPVLDDAAAMALATVMVASSMLPGDQGHARPTVRQASGRLPVAPSPHAPGRTAGVTMVRAGLATVPLTMSRVCRPLILPLLGAMLGLRGDEISLVFAVAAVVEIVGDGVENRLDQIERLDEAAALLQLATQAIGRLRRAPARGDDDAWAGGETQQHFFVRGVIDVAAAILDLTEDP